MNDSLEIRIHGDASLPTLIYFPGLHGDWTLCGPFRRKLYGQVRLVEFAYPVKVEWSLAEHAAAAAKLLQEHNISSGWLLGESFGSQILWDFVKRNNSSFKVEGIILAGGFVRYPILWLVRLARMLGQLIPTSMWKFYLKIYIPYSKRFREMSEADATEMLGRQREANRLIYRHRLRLIAENDPRDVTKNVACPVYHLTGMIDPIVPWTLVRLWLWKNCPTFAEGKMLPGDHNVLGSSPEAAAQQVLAWIGGKSVKASPPK